MSVPILTSTDIGVPAGPPTGDSQTQGEFSRMLNDELNVESTPVGEALGVQVEENVEVFDPTATLDVEAGAGLIDAELLDAGLLDGELMDLAGAETVADDAVVSALALTDDPTVDESLDEPASDSAAVLAGLTATVADTTESTESTPSTEVATDDLTAVDVAPAESTVASSTTESDGVDVDPIGVDVALDAEPVAITDEPIVADEQASAAAPSDVLADADADAAPADVVDTISTDAETTDVTAVNDAAMSASEGAVAADTDTSADASFIDPSTDAVDPAVADAAEAMTAPRTIDTADEAAAPQTTSNVSAPSATAAAGSSGTPAAAPAAPSAPMPPGVPGGDPVVETTLSRIAETIEAMTAQPPPRSISLDLTELHGIRIRISVDAGEVSVDVADTGAGSSGSDHWQRQLEDSLEDRRRGAQRFAAETAAAPVVNEPSTRPMADRGLRL